MAGPWITQRTLAEKLGCHVTTVSLALRNHESLPLATREKIQRLAREMGYSPDPALSSLIAYRRAIKPLRSGAVIGYLTSWNQEFGWRESFCDVAFFTGAQSRATELGYKFEHFWLRAPGLSAKRWNRIFQTRDLAGLILAPRSTGRWHLRLNWKEFCAVKIDPSMFWPPLHCVTNNQMEAMRLAVRQAFRHGYRRIGVAMRASHNERVNRYWSASFFDEQARRPNLVNIPICLPRQWQEKTVLQWVRKHKPDVILTTHLKVEGWLKNAGYRIPEDIGFIDLDRCNENPAGRAGINQQHSQVGATAVDILISQIQSNRRGLPLTAQVILMGNSWVNGNTIRPLPKRG
jgi:LacI family transcriptional regulator